MLTPEQETEIREKASRGTCHMNGCNNAGKNHVTLTFATETAADPPVAGRYRQVQAVISGWDCGDHRE